MKVTKKVTLDQDELEIISQMVNIAVDVYNEVDDPDEKTIADRLCDALAMFRNQFDGEFQ